MQIVKWMVLGEWQQEAHPVQNDNPLSLLLNKLSVAPRTKAKRWFQSRRARKLKLRPQSLLFEIFTGN